MPDIDSPLLRLLEKLDGKEVTVKVRAEDSGGTDDDFADRVHRALLKKKRSGPLGLGD